MKFSEYAAHAVVCSAGLSYVLEPDLTDTRLQIIKRTFISFRHSPLILTAYAAGMSVAPGEARAYVKPSKVDEAYVHGSALVRRASLEYATHKQVSAA